jgi:hypothetical protein
MTSRDVERSSEPAADPAADALRARLEQVAAEAAAELEAPPPTQPAAVPPDRIRPDDAERTVHFRAPAGSAIAVLVLGVVSLAAAALAVYAAYRDRLTSPTGLVAAGAAVAAAVVVSRVRGSSTAVWVEAGTLHVDSGTSHETFDLASPSTRLQMIGDPRTRRWKVLLLRRDSAYDVDRRMVADPVAFTAEMRRWRPEL